MINNDGGLSRLGHWGQISPKELGPAPFAVECHRLRWRKRVTDHSGGGARTQINELFDGELLCNCVPHNLIIKMASSVSYESARIIDMLFCTK